MPFLKEIEVKWQQKWEKAGIFEADPDPNKPKYYITVAYPYPNSPQHIGHGRTYTLADVHARYMRMRGYNVLLPMAFHYTGTPVLAMSKRLADGDQGLIDDFLNVYKIPKGKLKELTQPIAMARYFHQEIKMGMKEIGYSIDWRREFTTVDSTYNRFIEWQFEKLRKGGYITRGSHPVGWCPRDQNPVGQHDTVGDVEPEIGEFTLIKFKQDDTVFPAATLRPETVFGVTNIWLNPKAKYVRADVDGENWVISEDAVGKLTQLNHKVQVLEAFEGTTLIGKRVENPANQSKILILPADFVNPKNATGVVMSVPGHAPYDYLALENTKKDVSRLKEYSLKTDDLRLIEPISVIDVPNYSDIPAGDVVKKMNIQAESDAKLEAATKEVYRHEFHNGKMKANTGKYAGMPVATAKDKVRLDMIQEGKATSMYELLNRPVFCRCKTECIVKIFQDQWFIDYGKPEWKAVAHKNLDMMEILPEELRPEYNNVIDWLHEKACARKSGMGTRLPWDKEWIIESLSDSTIYMAYYTIAKHIKRHEISADQLSDEAFDCIFLGKGELSEVARRAGVNAKILEEMRDEFMYFYPLDSRHSAHELIPNHLTFMIFNHTAIFPEEDWPRQIATNGVVLMQGSKMSKSFGNIIPLREALAKFSADAIRLSVLATAELLQDADFSPAVAKSMQERLERLYRFVSKSVKTKSEKTGKPNSEFSHIEKWMLSRLQKHVMRATEAMEKLAVRKALQAIIYELDKDFQWYEKRAIEQEEGHSRHYIIDKMLEAQIRMLAPVAPHVCEEMYELTGGEGFVSLAPWPVVDENEIDAMTEERESLVVSVLEDTQKILRATRAVPKRIHYYVASSWKWDAFLRALEKSMSGSVSQKDLMKELLSEPKLRVNAERVAKFVGQILEEINFMPEDRKNRMLQTGVMNEKELLDEAKSFLQNEENADVYIIEEEDPERHDPKGRASFARPYRPAIYIE
jgi:leucyl-tRNA synthetase